MENVLAWLVSLTLAIILILSGAGLIASRPFLRLEYTRAGFPPDPYGFSTEERLYYAGLTLDYLFDSAGSDYLSGLEFDNGKPIYTEREIQHLADVKSAVRSAVVTYAVAMATTVASLFVLFRRRETRPTAWRAIRNGGLLNLSLLALIGIFALVAWDAFFEGFHTVLFPPGSWRFRYDDTLIRLFPERFWMDAALGVALVSGCGALAAVVIGISAARHRKPPSEGKS